MADVALPNVELGDYSVPSDWPTNVKFNEPGDVPGPVVQFEDDDQGDVKAGYGFESDNLYEGDWFFFHTDHLGSTSYLTDTAGNVSQFVCYTPYGEAIVDEHLTTYENPFKFSGKELDDITGLYDHGARSRNPISTLWYGVDPLFEKYPDFSPYNYCAGNPVKLVDLDGRKWIKRVVDGVVEIYYAPKVTKQEQISVPNSHCNPGAFVKDQWGSTVLEDGYTFEGYQFCADGVVKQNGIPLKNDYLLPKRGKTQSGKDYDLFLGVGQKSVNASTLHCNLMDSYTGPFNPKDYGGDYNYDYLPRKYQEWGSYYHDKAYDAKHAEGISGALFDVSVMDADWKLIKRNLRCADSALDGRFELGQALKGTTTAAVFGLIYGFKKIKKGCWDSW